MSVIEAINAALATVQDPELHRALPELGMVEHVAHSDGVADLTILLTISGCPMKDRLRTDITAAVGFVKKTSKEEQIIRKICILFFELMTQDFLISYLKVSVHFNALSKL